VGVGPKCGLLKPENAGFGALAKRKMGPTVPAELEY
jgi:hypothetical protein